MISISDLINELLRSRKAFHSEDDLKLSFGMAVKTLYPDHQIRLERPVEIQMVDRNNNQLITRAPIDIVIKDKLNHTIPIELKYKTKKSIFTLDNESYHLTGHGATDVGRYSFRKDIFRIEQFFSTHENCKVGYVFILTNDSAYQKDDVSKKNTFDKYFSFHHGAKIEQHDKSWNYENIDLDKYERKKDDNRWRYINDIKPHWTCTKENFYQLNLRHEYNVKWKSYSSIENSEFRYCVIKVEEKQ